MTLPKSLVQQNLHKVTPDTKVHEAAALMFREDIGALIVEKEGKLVGLLSERDLMNRLLVGRLRPQETLVGDIMSTRLVTIKKEETVKQALQLMSTFHIRHIPVVDENQTPIAMLSFRDLFALRLEQLEQENETIASLVKTDTPGG